MPTDLEVTQFKWLAAMQAGQMAAVEIARMMFWCKTPFREQEPDLVTMLALWTEADEKTKLLEDDSLTIEDEGLLSIRQIKDEVATQEGYMLASEEHQPRRYQNLLNKRLAGRIASLTARVTALAGVDDPEELEEVLEERDLLEYARMGINVIRMQERLPKVEYNPFVAGLQQIDIQLKGILSGYADMYKPPYAPETFWWRL